MENNQQQTRVIDRIQHLAWFKEHYDRLSENHYVLLQSAWLAVMGIRKNTDLDLFIDPAVSARYKPELTHHPLVNMKYNSKKFLRFGCRGDQDFFDRYTVWFCQHRFCQPRLYWAILKQKNTDKARRDLQAVRAFLAAGRHRQPPFNCVAPELWAVQD